MSNVEFHMDEMIDQKSEATGSKKGRVNFDFTARAGEHKDELLIFSIRDSLFLTDEDWAELNEITSDKSATVADIAEFWMGEDEYDRYVEAGGTPMALVNMVQKKVEAESGEDSDGRPTASNRSSRRAAARKRRKQH